MPGVLAVIELSFDPTLRLGELAIRWQTIGVTIALIAALAVAALMASRSQAGQPPGKRTMRLDDLVLIAAGTVPGAVIGGRLLHGLTFWESYAAAPLSVFDPSVGSLSLLGAVVGGALTGAYVARMVGAPLYRWADAASVPLLLAVGLGKVAQFLGGSGQGLPFDGLWSVAFTGDGPWVSANAGLPSHPSQLYEAVWALIGIPIVLRLAGGARTPVTANPMVAWADRGAPPGRLIVLALGWFFAGRVLIGFTWRDPSVVGPLNPEQIAALLALGLLAYGLGGRRRIVDASTV